MAKMIEAVNPYATWTSMGRRSVLNVFLCGLIVGVATYLVYMLLERFVFQPIACNGPMAVVRCESSTAFSSGTAMVLGSLLGLVLLVRERVYRPILAILGVVIGLWGLLLVLATLPWFVAVLAAGIVFGLAYLLFSWLVQPTNFFVGLMSVVVVTVVCRVALSV